MTNAFQLPPKSPRTDPHKHSLALIVDVTKISNIFFRDPKKKLGPNYRAPGVSGVLLAPSKPPPNPGGQQFRLVFEVAGAEICHKSSNSYSSGVFKNKIKIKFDLFI